MNGLWQDVRFAVRLLIKGRWFTLAAIVALALGIGANNTVFTLVNAILLRSLPFDRPEQIMMIDTRNAQGRQFGVSLLDFEDWRRASRTFSGLSFAMNGTFNLSGDEQVPEQYTGVYISANAFAMIGEQAAIGRTFRPEDDQVGAQPVLLLASSVWKLRYGSDPAVLGRIVRVNGLPATVIGVMAEGMKFPFNSDAWLPMSAFPPAFRQQGRQSRNYMAIGRLADGVTLEQARAEMTNISTELARQYPTTNKDMTAVVTPFVERTTGPQVKVLMWTLMGAVAFVLLIACANVANLLLARAAHRTREVSVRTSLGATRWRIVRQLLVESLLLSVISGIVGYGLALLGIRWFDLAIVDVGKPFWMTFTMDARVFAFFVLVCLATGVTFGLAPALHVSKTNVNEVLKEGGRSGSSGARARRWTSALIVAELTLTLVLLAGAGFMMRSFLKLYNSDAGIDTSRLLVMQLILPVRKYPNIEDRVTFLQRVDERLSAVNTIEAAAASSNLPMGGGITRSLIIDGRTAQDGQQRPTVSMVTIGPRYFDALGVKLVRGQPFTDVDGTAGHESVIVNQRLVAMYFQGQDPIGQRIQLADDSPNAAPPTWMTITGVSPDVRQRSAGDPDPDPVAYLPHFSNPSAQRGTAIIVRTRNDPGKAAALLREEIRVLDPDMPLSNIRTMDQFLAQQRWPFRVFGTMFAIFAIIAIVLATVGLYAVTAYSVTQRTQEIGVRMALGAEPRQVRWLILRSGIIHLAIGLVLGLGGAVGVGRLLRSVLVGSDSTDFVTLGSIAALMAFVAMAACVLPARQATRLNPVVALRYE